MGYFMKSRFVVSLSTTFVLSIIMFNNYAVFQVFLLVNFVQVVVENQGKYRPPSSDQLISFILVFKLNFFNLLTQIIFFILLITVIGYTCFSATLYQ